MIKASFLIILACSISCSSYRTQSKGPETSNNTVSIQANNEKDLYEIFDQITDTKVIELKNRIYNLDKPLILNNLSHITINGNGAVLVLDSLVNDVVELNRCHNVTIDNIKALHKEVDGPVGCTGNVILINGGSNITIIKDSENFSELISKDIGPGNCLIDNWVRKNSNKKYDKDGLIAASGTTNEIIFEQAQELYINRNNKNKLSFDTNDFDISFIRGLNFEDGIATLTDFTASIISEQLSLSLQNFKETIQDILVCGGGRKNIVLLNKIKKNLSPNINLRLIDDYKIDGDFIESQAFAFLAIRSILNLPTSFPKTTGCKNPCTGGELIKKLD